jgi:hypothetical protein
MNVFKNSDRYHYEVNVMRWGAVVPERDKKTGRFVSRKRSRRVPVAEEYSAPVVTPYQYDVAAGLVVKKKRKRKPRSRAYY